MRQPPVRRHTMQGLLALLLAWACLLGAPVWAQNVELPTVRTSRGEGTLDLEFAVRLSLPRAVEDALVRRIKWFCAAEFCGERGGGTLADPHNYPVDVPSVKNSATARKVLQYVDTAIVLGDAV